MDIQNIFELLNLKDEHLKVYLANLEWGETIITNIARKSKLPRTTVYILIKDLLDIGLVTQTMKDGKALYIAADPEFIRTLLEQRQIELKNSISYITKNMAELKAKQNANPKKPKVEFLEGAEGIKQAYNRTFEAKEMLIQCLSEDYEQVVSEKFMNEYFNRFFKQTNIKSKELLREADDEYIKKYGSEKNLQLKVQVKGKVETDFWIYEDKVVFVSFNKDRPYALSIEDVDIAKAMKNLYELAWKQAQSDSSKSRR